MNAIGAQLRNLIQLGTDPIDDGVWRYGWTLLSIVSIVYIAKIGREERSPRVSIRLMIDDSSWVWRMIGLARYGTAEPLSLNQILRRVRGQGNINFPSPAAS